MKIEFSTPTIGESEAQAVLQVLQSGWLSKGPTVELFEKVLSNVFKSRNVICVNSCTSALHLALLAYDIKKGDEVITTPLTFVSTINAILYTGATPVLADIDEKTWNINPEEIRKKITSKTKAIIPVHFSGLPCDMNEILKIAKEHNLKVIEDGAHALGSQYDNKWCCTIGDIGCTSFYATKNITTGDGGAIFTDDDKIAEKIKRLAFHGLSSDAWNRYNTQNIYLATELGYKYNMTDIEAALGIEQLKKLKQFGVIRNQACNLYRLKIYTKHPLDKIIKYQENQDTDKYKKFEHLFTIYVKDLNRNVIRQKLLNININTGIHFPAIFEHPYHKKKLKLNPNDYPICKKISKGILSLPLYPKLTTENINYIINNLEVIIKNEISKTPYKDSFRDLYTV